MSGSRRPEPKASWAAGIRRAEADARVVDQVSTLRRVPPGRARAQTRPALARSQPAPKESEQEQSGGRARETALGALFSAWKSQLEATCKPETTQGPPG